MTNILNQYETLMSDDSSKKEKKEAYRILTDYAHVQNAPDAWMYLANYYMNAKKPLGVSFLYADRNHKALECLKEISSDNEWRDTANLLILELLSNGSTKNNSKAHALARSMLNPPFNYRYELQKVIFSQMIIFIEDSVKRNAIFPDIENLESNKIEAFAEVWSRYQERHKCSGRAPEDELQMMYESYAYAHYLFFESYIEEKLFEGYQGAYWAYGFVFLNQCNHLMHPVYSGCEEYNKLEIIFMNGLMKEELGALRAIVELYYEEKITNFFSNKTVQLAIAKLKELYPDEYESMIESFEDDGIQFP